MSDNIAILPHDSAFCVELTNGPQDTHCGACEQRMQRCDRCDEAGVELHGGICGSCGDDLRGEEAAR